MPLLDEVLAQTKLQHEVMSKYVMDPVAMKKEKYDLETAINRIGAIKKKDKIAAVRKPPKAASNIDDLYF